MFHVMLVLMGVGMAAAVIAIMIIPLWLGPLIQLLVAFFSKGKIARWIPCGLGVLVFFSSIYFFCIEEKAFSPGGVVFYWIIYALFLWAADAVGRRLKNWFSNRKAK